MMDGLSDILKVMTAFHEGRLSPADFVDQYMTLWKALVKEQDEAIARQPDVEQALRELREQFRYGEITSETYTHGVQEQYARLQNVRLRPGTEAAQTLDHVFVEADSYDEAVDEPEEPYINAEQLREVVREALETLARS